MSSKTLSEYIDMISYQGYHISNCFDGVSRSEKQLRRMVINLKQYYNYRDYIVMEDPTSADILLFIERKQGQPIILLFKKKGEII